MKYEKVALVGIGNIMFHDEGLGTPEALAQMPKLVQATLEELENTGINLKRNNRNMSFEEIIEFYAHPKVIMPNKEH